MVDLDELRLAVRRMTRKQRLYKVLKEELTARGYWRELPRGKADVYNLAGQQRPQTAPDDY